MRYERRPRTTTRRLAVLLGAASLASAGCGGEDKPDGNAGPVIEDPGPVHVHGLGINPRDGALFIATHTGLFRAPKGEGRAVRVAGRYQDTMGFTVVGPDRFLGSGHPDARDRLPPFLGLIDTRDAGRSWKPISLLGQTDFHVLEAAGDRVYGHGTDFESRKTQFLVSSDGGRSWESRRAPEPLISLAIDPRDPDRLIVSGQRGLYTSRDGGRGWERREGPPGLLAWLDTDRAVLITGNGEVRTARGEGPWRRVGAIGGAPGAFEAEPDGLYAALHDGTVKRSSDGGRTWTVRSRP
jgi:hypothetical protein